MVDGVIFAPSSPTCHGKVYDFFVVSRTLAHAVESVNRIEDAGLHPHWPARLILRSTPRRRLVRKLVKPRAVSGTLPLWPSPAACVPWAVSF